MDAARTPLIVGPTAVGKSAVAMALAERWPIEIVSADSRQVYIGLDIATAKPSRRDRDRVPHHLIDLVRPGIRFSAGRFAEEAAAAIAATNARGNRPVVVGGTGLYVKALVDGLFREPPLDRPRRDALFKVTTELPNATLVRWADRLDPEHSGGGGRHRASRAIEMAILTGYPLSWWQRAAKAEAAIKPFAIRLSVPRAVLHRRIEARARQMVEQGIVEEAAAALADGAALDAAGMDGIGVREAVAVLQGNLDRANLAAAIATSTRQYAKRQETWFRHQLGDDVLALDATRPAEQLASEIIAAWEASKE